MSPLLQAFLACSEQGRRDGGERDGRAVLDKVSVGKSREKVTLEREPEEREGKSLVRGGKSIPGLVSSCAKALRSALDGHIQGIGRRPVWQGVQESE